MGKINRLDQHLSNMIAAGEVVERPMGIVKELVENCIDAKAQHIEIQIIQGGIDTITIIDDGDGMDGNDATLAFERHATSKLKEVNDLWNIHTMGFRGEALPSIASVSHVLLRTNNGQESTEVEIKYGSLIKARPCGTPKGTMIEVKNLFQKTPARFKHLKSPQYEFSLISDVVQKFALSNPEIGFSLSHDGREIFKTRGNGNLLEVLMQIYGRETAKTAIQLVAKDTDYELHGYGMQPQFNRATKYYILLYINGRMIRNYHLQKAIMDAYSHYMPKDRYPIVILDIKMDAQLVDVNVHPSKWEIRLSKEKQLEKLIYETLSAALKEQHAIPSVSASKDTKKERVEMQTLEFTYSRDESIHKLHKEVNDGFAHPENIPVVDEKKVSIDLAEVKKETAIRYPQPIKREAIQEVKEHATTYAPIKKSNIVSLERKVDTPAIMNDVKEPLKTVKEEKNIVVSTEQQIETSIQVKTQISEEEDVKQAFEANANVQDLQYEKIQEETKPKNPSLPQLRVIGQFHNCYIIAEGEKGLYIVDQHAAQERYHFELISKQILSGMNDSQPLLLPLTIESTMSAIAQVDDLNAIMEQIGIHLEAFGNHTFVCRELPTWMKDTKEEEFLTDMIDIWEKDKEISLEKLRKHAIATMACHSSIRFNRSLTMDEMRQVIDDLGKCEQPFHCPHGRPTLICMEEKDLIHDFERG